MRRRRPSEPAASDAMTAAISVHRLAVLLQAGLTPARAWHHVAGGEQGLAGAAHDAAAIPGELDRRGGTWREVAVAWRVATTVGAPLAPSLRAIADALRDAEQARADVAVALAEPATTARLIGWLPALGVVLVVAFGFDVASTLLHPVGLVCAALGAGLMVGARRWTAALVRRAQPPPGIAGWEHELLSIALSGGVSIDRALDVVTAAGCPSASEATADTIALSRGSGAPAVELLRAEAEDRRLAARTEGRLRAARLGGRLLLPLGACTLPAFLLLGVAPMLLSVLTSSSIGF
ncbi:type II secretion system F family protein [Microbacterium sp. PA5]|uniref:type II secretion system F family protein n=1 Tax=Microbacterium sp. PA5 TaxID=3416654 RepID=UPI003CF91154